MKKLFSFMMALVLVLSLSVTAFAAENTGSITITNATIDQSYAPYKIFDASISGGDDGGFTYSMKKTNQFFELMFGNPADPENKFDTNPYFIFTVDKDDATKGSITMRATASREDVLDYLWGLIYVKDTEDVDGDNNTEELIVRSGLTPEKPAVKADGNTVLFDDLDYGYYLVTSTLGTIVTIDSTHPDVEVIDKNQKPGENFTKLVWDEDYVDPETGAVGAWVVSSSANIGDIVDFKVEFDATNYNGEKQVQHYIVGDNKGNALWVEFNSIEITVGGKPIGKGWYHCTDNDPSLKLNTGEWTAAENPEIWATSPEEADWFLIHNGYDDFDIVIPWLKDHTFSVEEKEDYENEYTLSYPEDPESKYDALAKVVIKYNASVEPSANIDGDSNLYNTADLSWKDETIVTPPGTPTTNLTVHALGVTKTDGSTSDLLAGAVFNIYKNYDKDKGYSNPVYVIPTNVKGVYILDDLYTFVSGENRETSREKYADYLDEYLGTDIQKNEVETQANGKLVILGLESGTYYLEETAAPTGYNKLTGPVTVTIGKDTPTIEFAFATDDDGNVVTENATQTHIYKKVVNAPVTNNKGTQLPSTGGKGTMMLITIGSLVAMAFAVLLITHKKMSVYHD